MVLTKKLIVALVAGPAVVIVVAGILVYAALIAHPLGPSSMGFALHSWSSEYVGNNQYRFDFQVDNLDNAYSSCEVVCSVIVNGESYTNFTHHNMVGVDNWIGFMYVEAPPGTYQAANTYCHVYHPLS